MKRASITEAKNGLSALIDKVKGGASVLIMDRGRPVARLEPVAASHGEGHDPRLSRLVRDGIVRPGREQIAKLLLSETPPRPKPGASAVETLLRERREGR